MADCDEIQGSLKVSAYKPDRLSRVRMMVGAKQRLVVDFNGALAKRRTIQAVDWKSDPSFYFKTSNPRIESKSRRAAIDIEATDYGWGYLRCSATLDNGEVAVHTINIDVKQVFM